VKFSHDPVPQTSAGKVTEAYLLTPRGCGIALKSSVWSNLLSPIGTIMVKRFKKSTTNDNCMQETAKHVGGITELSILAVNIPQKFCRTYF
jgi:hypothetical protein